MTESFEGTTGRSSAGSRRRLAGIACLAGVAVAVVTVGGFALTVSDEDRIPTSGVSAQAGPGISADVPPSAVSLVDLSTMEFLGTGPGGLRVWRAAGRAPQAAGLTCYVAAGADQRVPVSGTDCDSPEAFSRRGVSLSGTTAPDGRFVGYAVLSDGLSSARLDGRDIPVQNGIAFIDAEPGARELRAEGGARSVAVSLSGSTQAPSRCPSEPRQVSAGPSRASSVSC